VIVSVFFVRGRDLRTPEPAVAEPALEQAGLAAFD
jgi:hypothetical protein